MTDEQVLSAAGYKLVTWADFQSATDVPVFIRKIAEGVHDRWGGAFVVYDPAGGDDGWLLVEDDRELLVRETAQHLRERQTEPDLQPLLF
jgi:hypothetical protein